VLALVIREEPGGSCNGEPPGARSLSLRRGRRGGQCEIQEGLPSPWRIRGPVRRTLEGITGRAIPHRRLSGYPDSHSACAVYPPQERIHVLGCSAGPGWFSRCWMIRPPPPRPERFGLPALVANHYLSAR
jgi:hypothetical protein